MAGSSMAQRGCKLGTKLWNTEILFKTGRKIGTGPIRQDWKILNGPVLGTRVGRTVVACRSIHSTQVERSDSKSDDKPHCTDEDGKPVNPEEFNCWNCLKFLDCISPNSEEKFKCTACDFIQPPQQEMNYFEYFGMGQNFDLDRKHLTRRFRELQFIIHPDHFAQKSEKERAFAEEQSALINKAYRTLLNPLSRAEYILEIHGYGLGEKEQTDDPELLMEVLELNEEINEAGNDEDVKKMEQNAADRVKEYEREVAAAFTKEDWAAAKEITSRMRYFITVLKNAQRKLGFDV